MENSVETTPTLYKTSKLEVIYKKSSFINHTFYAESNNDIMFHVIKMLDSLYIWIGDKKQPQFTDLSLAMKNKYANQPLGTSLVGESSEETSKNLALQLCKKLNKVVYVSLNIVEDRFNLQLVVKRIHEEIVTHPEYF